MLGDREKELQHEEETDAAAQAARLQVLLTESQQGSVELPRAAMLISRMYFSVREQLETVAGIQTRGMGGKYKTWLRALDPGIAAILAIRLCIKLCTSHTVHSHVRAQDLCLQLGKLYELEVRIAQATAVNPLYMQKIEEQIKDRCTTNQAHIRKVYDFAIAQVMQGEIEFELTRADMIHIGKFGVDACLNAGLIDLHRGTNRMGVTVEYHLNEDILEFLTGYSENDVRRVVAKDSMRMLCAPDPWTNLADGGYLTVRRKTEAPLMSVRRLRKSERARVAAAFTQENMPVVFDAGNYLQSIPYTVHEATRIAMQRVWELGGGAMGVPTKNPPVRPECPMPPEWHKDRGTKEEVAQFGTWKRRVVAYHKELRKWRGKVRELGYFFQSSRDVGEPIWFPVYFDTRGRWYYRGTPNPQGSDLSKAVLHFHQKKRLGPDGVYWLKVSIANSFGFDKERFNDRVQWVDQNWESISNALDDPENHLDVWGTDAPWCMYAAAWELREAMRSGNPAEYHTGIPVHMDATCSGLQHFSAILRDPVGAQYVNLNDEARCGPKQDIYARVAQNAMRVIHNDMQDSDEDVAAMATWWNTTGISRKMAKHPVMTFVYGATVKGTAEHIEDYILNELRLQFPVERESMAYCRYAGRKLFLGIEATVPAAAEAMRWLRSIAQQQPNGKRMEWRTPTGFLVQHDYQDRTENRIKLNSCGVTHLIVREPTEDTKASDMQNAISPNFVHALDASHLTLTAQKMRNANLCMVGIHDSFGTHPSDVGKMHSIIRESFVELYENRNILGEFLWDVGGIGEPPRRGDFDIRSVLDSEFFFC